MLPSCAEYVGACLVQQRRQRRTSVSHQPDCSEGVDGAVRVEQGGEGTWVWVRVRVRARVRVTVRVR